MSESTARQLWQARVDDEERVRRETQLARNTEELKRLYGDEIVQFAKSEDGFEWQIGGQTFAYREQFHYGRDPQLTVDGPCPKCGTDPLETRAWPAPYGITNAARLLEILEKGREYFCLGCRERERKLADLERLANRTFRERVVDFISNPIHLGIGVILAGLALQLC